VKATFAVCALLLLISISVFAQSGTFTMTGNMTIPRVQHGVALLPGGQVLVVGGVSNYAYVSSAEIYNAATGRFTVTGSMLAARSFCALGGMQPVTLASGKVLVAGGFAGQTLSSSELYDPATGTFSATGSMSTERWCPTMTQLGNGKVLVAGGYSSQKNKYQSSAEIYDPATGTFTATGSMSEGRDSAMAAVLQDGRVLIAGGVNSVSQLKSAEIYDPNSGTFSGTGDMHAVHAYPFFALTTLRNGKVLRTGEGFGQPTEIYDPATGVFSLSAVETFPDYANVTLLLKNGQVLIAGYNSYVYTPSISPFANAYKGFASYNSAIMLSNGSVLVCGGLNAGPYSDQAGIYTPEH